MHCADGLPCFTSACNADLYSRYGGELTLSPQGSESESEGCVRAWRRAFCPAPGAAGGGLGAGAR
eukprot:5838674-Lingulodinium_polyedra.AAC.1